MSTNRTTENVRRAETPEAVGRCFAVYQELRPHLLNAEDLIRRWEVQRPEGFRIVYIEEEEQVVAAAGYRYLHTTAWGHILYVDDLVAVSSRHGLGLGTVLLKYLQEEARRAKCDEVHLDSGYQRHRAHLAYLRNGFRMVSHHFSWKVEGSGGRAS